MGFVYKMAGAVIDQCSIYFIVQFSAADSLASITIQIQHCDRLLSHGGDAINEISSQFHSISRD